MIQNKNKKERGEGGGRERGGVGKGKEGGGKRGEGEGGRGGRGEGAEAVPHSLLRVLQDAVLFPLPR